MKVLNFLAVLLIVVGRVAMALATLSSIGYLIYEWAHDIQFKLALWDAFVLWLKLIFGGLGIVFIGLIAKFLVYIGRK